MSDRPKSIAMIPARIGSTRLKMKNLALIAGEPMIGHVIRAALESGAFDRVIVNADSPVFADIAERFGAEFYHRPAALGSSDTKSDDVVADFMKAHPADAVAWVNPISPLQTAQEIADVVAHFHDQALDSLITVEEKQVHAMYGEDPVNFNFEGKFAQTQELQPVLPFVYSVMMWRCEPFLADMDRQGFAFFCGQFGAYPVNKLSGLIIKTDEDLLMADAIASARKSGDWAVQYDPAAEAAEAAAKEEKNG